MARSKATPERSKLVRPQPTAFARRQRGDGDDNSEKKSADPAKPATEPAKPAEAAKTAPSLTQPDPSLTQPDPAKPAPSLTQPDPNLTQPDPNLTTQPDPSLTDQPNPGQKPAELPEIEPPSPKGEPWPDATPEPMRPVEPVARARTETVSMPPTEVIGKPPEMPKAAPPPPVAVGNVEALTYMPGPREVPSGNPDDKAPPPGRVPPGDSRSLRRGGDFALIYRISTFVITRSGVTGTRGQWRVVEYPTSASASHSYAKECSRFVSEGFSDYRD